MLKSLVVPLFFVAGLAMGLSLDYYYTVICTCNCCKSVPVISEGQCKCGDSCKCCGACEGKNRCECADCKCCKACPGHYYKPKK